MITFDYNGETYEFQGVYARPHDQDFLNDTGGVLHSFGMWPVNELRAIVRPVRQEYTFGGVRFRETGKRRVIRQGEWGLVKFPDGTLKPHYEDLSHSVEEHTILEPC